MKKTSLDPEEFYFLGLDSDEFVRWTLGQEKI